MGRYAEKIKKYSDADETDAALIEHGIRILLCDGRGAAGVLFCAFLLKDVKPALYWIAVFAMLRTSCGGWHAESEKGCFAVYVSLYLVSFLLRSVHIPAGVFAVTEILCVMYTVPCAPVQHIYQPLDADEVKACRTRMILVLLGMVVLQGICGMPVLKLNTAAILINAGSMELLKHTKYWRNI